MDYCSICPRNYRPIQGDGPKHARIMAIGERPGRDELRVGIPFVGASGMEFNDNYLHLAGLSRREIYVTNSVKCFANQNRKPTPAEVAGCSLYHLKDEIREVQPEIILLLGATACSLVPSVQLEVEHGIPQWCEDLYGWQGYVVPMFHPASGLHDTRMMIQMLDDWAGIKDWLSGGEHPNVGDVLNTHYKLVYSANEVDDYFHRYPSSRIAVDTESHNGVPFSVQASLHQGTGIMVLLDAQKHRSGTALQSLGSWMIVNQGELIFHNAEADIDIVNKLVNGEKFRYRDTMAEAYNLGNLPQGLKALGYRLLGIRMQSWRDTVLEPSLAALMEWMLKAIELESTRPLREEKQLKTRIKVTEKPNAEEKLLNRVLAHMLKNPEYDPWERLEGIKTVEDIGPYPVLGIANCRLEDAVEYGVRDADVTLRLANELDRLRGQAQAQWGVLPEDCDV